MHIKLLLFPFVGLWFIACAAPAPVPAPGGLISSTGTTGSSGTSGSVSAEDIAKGGECAEATGAGTNHAVDIKADETWTAAASPHVIATGIRINANVTLEKCAVVTLGKGASLFIGGSALSDAGSLTAKGEIIDNTPNNENDDDYTVHPVLFVNKNENEHWGQLIVDANGKLDLTVAALIRGGELSSSSNGGGAILGRGLNDGSLSKIVRALVVFVIGSDSYGVNMRTGAAFTDDSSLLVVKASGSAGAPEAVAFMTPGVGTLPLGLYTGNMKDEVIIDGRIVVNHDDGFRAVGIPYHVTTDFLFRPIDTTPITLTIEAGTTLKFDRQLVIGDTSGEIKRPATLVATGTAKAPILFTSSKTTPAAGDWVGIWMKGPTPTGNSLEFATIEYAGGDSSANSYGCGPKDNDSAIFISEDRPNAFIKNSTFKHIGGETVIVSGWVSNETGPDLATSNTFESTASCLQSLWRSTEANYCPVETPEDMPNCYK